MNIRSIRSRLILWYASLFVLLVLAFGSYSYIRLRHYLEESLSQMLEHRAERIGMTMLANMDEKAEPSIRSQISALYTPELNDRFMRVTRADGRVIYVSGAPNDGSFDPGEVAPANVKITKLTTRIQKLGNGVKLLLASMPVQSPSGRYVVEVGSGNEGLMRILNRYVETLSFSLPLLSIIAIGGGYFLIGRALSPVQRIIAAARKITLKDLNTRLPIPSTGDVIEALSRTLNQMIARLEESFQASNRFTSDASHELRTPLTIIRGELETLLLDVRISDSVRVSLESLQEEADRLSKIVEGLLALSRLDAGAGQMENVRFDLSELVTTTSEQMCLLAEDKEIRVEIQAGLPVYIEGDKERLKQVVVNLLDNAIKYTPQGGKVEVKVSSNQDRALFEVVDTGPGIGSDALPYVFERFYRAAEMRRVGIEGAGLGLPIVKAICTAHGGSVTACSIQGNGCRMTVELPLSKKCSELN